MAVKIEGSPQKVVIRMGPPQEATTHLRPQTYTPIVPVCALLASFGLFHFRHGPLRTRIVSILSQVYAAVLIVLNLALLIGASVCVGHGGSVQAKPLEIGYCFLTLINLINYCFMFYICWREIRFAAVLNALVDIKQFLQEQGCSILTIPSICLMLLLAAFHIATITYFVVSFDGRSISTFLLDNVGLYQCTSDTTIRRMLLGVQPFLWVSSSLLPCWFYLTLTSCTWMSIRNARRYLKYSNISYSMTILANTVHQVSQLVGAMDSCFKWYLLLMIGMFAALAFVSIVVLGEFLWALWLLCPVIIGLFAAFLVNYEALELAETVCGFWTCETATVEDLMKISLIVTQITKGWVGMTLCGVEALSLSGFIAKAPVLAVTFFIGLKFIPSMSFNNAVTNSSDTSQAAAILDSSF